MNNKRFSQSRSHFYLQSFKNDNDITFNTNQFTKSLIHKCQSEIEDLSPTGWKKSKKYDDLYNLWIPDNRIDYYIQFERDLLKRTVSQNISKQINKCFGCSV